MRNLRALRLETVSILAWLSASACAGAPPPVVTPPAAASADAPLGTPDPAHVALLETAEPVANAAATDALGACPGPEAARPEPAAAPEAGYDRLLSGYPYPYEVKRFELSVQGTRQCMAYMDVQPQPPRQPNGHVVLLLHGKNFSGAYWKSTADALLERGYRVIMPDQIGFGKSSKPTNVQYSFALLAKNTALLLDALGVERASVVGHSMGGMLATRWAAQYPERTDQLVLVNPIGLEDYRRMTPYVGVDAWQEQAARQTPESIRQYMQKNYFHDSWQPAYDPLLEIQVGWARGPDRSVLARVSALTQDMLYTQPVVADFESVRAPTLLVIGQADRTAPGKTDVPPEVAAKLGNYPELGERAARAIPGARLVRLEGVGHVPQYEAFERWREALLSFLPGKSAAVPRSQ